MYIKKSNKRKDEPKDNSGITRQIRAFLHFGLALLYSYVVQLNCNGST